MTKKIVAFALVLVTVLALCTTAFAAKPKASIPSWQKSQYSYKGGSVSWDFTMKSGSYTKLFGKWRARFESIIIYPYDNGTYDQYASKAYKFTGTVKKRLTWQIGYYNPAGWYWNVYGTYYRNSGSGKWKVNKAKKAVVYVY